MENKKAQNRHKNSFDKDNEMNEEEGRAMLEDYGKVAGCQIDGMMLLGVSEGETLVQFLGQLQIEDIAKALAADDMIHAILYAAVQMSITRRRFEDTKKNILGGQ